jgi:hypothetical protein
MTAETFIPQNLLSSRRLRSNPVALSDFFSGVNRQIMWSKELLVVFGKVFETFAYPILGILMPHESKLSNLDSCRRAKKTFLTFLISG